MKLYYIGFAASAIALLASCSDQLDYHEYAGYDQDYISEKWDKVNGIVTYAYSKLDEDLGNTYEGAMLSSATDEAVYAVGGSKIESFYNGSWSPVNANDQIWKDSYEGISYCNLFLDEFNGLTFPDYALDERYNQYTFWYNNFQYEARWLRAYYYFNLIRQYGDVPFKTTNLSADESNALPRTSADEIFAYIDEECQSVADSIVKDYANLGILALPTAIENGRANDLAVMALRSRAALYHASPLFNPAGDMKRWEHAKKVTKVLIDSCEARGMSLISDYGKLFDKDNFKNGIKEVIFARRTLADFKVEKWNYPVSMTNASGGNCPSQTLVDAYQMASTGKYWNEEGSGFDAANPYKGRDKRFAATIAVNGEHWPNGISDDENTGIQSYIGGRDGLPIKNATPTSYYLKKYVEVAQLIAGKDDTKSNHAWVVFRLAETYLNYAEIMMKLGDYTTALTYINKVRKRAGLPNLKAEELTWERYQDERFVELAFEGHRFFDVRRWKEAPKFFTTIKTQTITLNADSTFTYQTVVDNTTRKWDDKMYLFPIPQADMLKSQGGWSQNPGW